MSNMLGWQMLAVSTFITFIVMKRFIHHVRHRELVVNRPEYLLYFLACTYAFGASAKILGIGPELLRFYVADFAFPAVLVIFLSVPSMLWSSNGQGKTIRHDSSVNVITANIRFANHRMLAAAAAFCICLTYEIVSHLNINHSTDQASTYEQIIGSAVGGFDWIDVLMYALGALVVVIVLWRTKILLERHPAYLNS